MSNFTEIRLSGSGGQGLILAGIILAKAAVLEKKRVTQTQSYGPESRGGYSRADVLISDKEILFPEATQFDILMALTQEACDKFIFDIKEKGTLIVDTTFVKNISVLSDNIYEVPFTEVVTEKLGNSITTNICALGFLVKVTGVVKEESLQKAIADSVRPAFLDLNLKAMKLGFELAENYGKQV
ncbi:MAG TPA: 2-oxoacid:acceptor oxidoreductase family protein [Candidatus Cloacimonadota bacterium]|nr:2-oxoacid:acceptor oxidoreductase family protein [Candidatus Cloacimonadota bacterium]HOV16065.1 2-oxoacid:acceptor oxidoreductase family protein [Candidatus Cloacimonadota bacterium]HQL15392.1 2-oxoacid:acceptor oxidoreductase family protein [Candidatus Cloacimonadota bacterium]